MTATNKRANGEGSIYRRSDGLWVAACTVTTTAGISKRISLSSKTRAGAAEKLRERLDKERRGIRTSTTTQTVGEFLDDWLNNVVPVQARPRTVEIYESTVRLHIKPALGAINLSRLRPLMVQAALDAARERGTSNRSLLSFKQVLSAASSHAERLELIERNAAKLVKIPTYRRETIVPWSLTEAEHFLDSVRSHRWYAAFLILTTCGLRRGEVLGLRWRDIDLDAGTIHVREQLQRIEGTLQLASLKTHAGTRDLPMTTRVHAALSQAAETSDSSEADGFVFVSRSGAPIDPKVFTKTFLALSQRAGLRRITVHHLRHTAATFLKNAGATPKDTQEILGHAHIRRRSRSTNTATPNNNAQRCSA